MMAPWVGGKNASCPPCRPRTTEHENTSTSRVHSTTARVSREGMLIVGRGSFLRRVAYIWIANVNQLWKEVRDAGGCAGGPSARSTRWRSPATFTARRPTCTPPLTLQG